MMKKTYVYNSVIFIVKKKAESQHHHNESFPSAREAGRQGERIQYRCHTETQKPTGSVSSYHYDACSLA